MSKAKILSLASCFIGRSLYYDISCERKLHDNDHGDHPEL